MVDPEECILYPENPKGVIYYDDDNDEMAFGDYKYLVMFKEKGMLHKITQRADGDLKTKVTGDGEQRICYLEDL